MGRSIFGSPSVHRAFAIAVAVGAAAAVSNPLYAQTKKWDGNGSSANQDWGTATNWDLNPLPGSTSDIVIDTSLLATLPTQMTTSGLTMTVKSITFDNTVALTLGNVGNGG